MDDVVVKRGRGRPKGSLNKARVLQPRLPPEEVEALKRRLAEEYARAVAAQAMAIDRKRRVKASIRSTFGNRGFQDVEPLIVAAQERIAPTASEFETDANRLDSSAAAIDGN